MKRFLLLISLLAISLTGSLPTQAQDESGGIDLALMPFSPYYYANLGEPISVSIDFANHSSIETDSMIDIVVSGDLSLDMDSLPDGCTGNTQAIACDLGPLRPFISQTFTATATTATVGQHTITAMISGTDTDIKPSDNTVKITAIVTDPALGQAADLSLKTEVSTSSPSVGEPFVYSVTWQNNGPDTVIDATVTIPLPDTTDYLEGDCLAQDSTITCSLNSLESGVSGSTDVVLIPLAEGVFPLSAAIWSFSNTDPIPSNSWMQTSVIIGGMDTSSNAVPSSSGEDETDTVMSLSSPAPTINATAGEPFDLTVNWTNDGPNMTDNANLNIFVPDASFAPPPDGCSTDEYGVECDLPENQPGDSGSYTFTATFTNPITYHFEASIYSSSSDLDPDDKITYEVVVMPGDYPGDTPDDTTNGSGADLAVASLGYSTPGQAKNPDSVMVDWQNLGPDENPDTKLLIGGKITGTIDGTYLPPDCEFTGDIIAGNLGTVPPDASGTYSFSVNFDEPGDYDFSATLTGTGSDPYAGNNSSVITITAVDDGPTECKATDPGVTFTPDPCSWSDANAYTGWVSACHGAGLDPDVAYPSGTECFSARDNCRIRLTCPTTTPLPTGPTQTELPPLDPITRDNAQNVTQIGGFTSDQKITNFDFAGDKVLFTHGYNVYVFRSHLLDLPEIEPIFSNGGLDSSVHIPTLIDRLLQVEPNPIVLHHDGLSDVLFDPAGTLVATASFDGTVRLWNADTGDNLFEAQAHLDNVWEMAFSSDGNLLATAGNSTADPDAEFTPPNQVAIWDVTSGEQLVVMNISSEIHSLAFSPDGTVLATGGGLSNVNLWDTGSGAALATIDHAPTITNDWVTNVSFSPDGAQLVAVSYSFARVYEVAQWQEQYTVPDSFGGQHAAFGVDSSVIFTGGYKNVRISDAATGAELNTLVELQAQQVLLSMNLNREGTLLTTVVGDLDPETNTIETVEVAYWGAATGLAIQGEPEPPDTTSAEDEACTVSANSNVNLRSGPGTTYAITGILTAGNLEPVDGQATGAAGFVWWHLELDAWVRSDVVIAPDSCASVPERNP